MARYVVTPLNARPAMIEAENCEDAARQYAQHIARGTLRLTVDVSPADDSRTRHRIDLLKGEPLS